MSGTVARSPVLRVTGLRKEYRVRERGRHSRLVAVDGVDLVLYPGETVALVGESGSGKSTVAKSIARLVEPTGGEIAFGGLDVTTLDKKGLTRLYGDVQMVFQDPSSSLNPRMTVRRILDEPLRLHGGYDRDARAQRVAQLLADVGLGPEHLERHPRQLSGGQRQRVGIARALAVDPTLVLLDEPTASLDVSVRSQILNLLRGIQRDRNMAYLFISHDLEVVRRVSDRVVVMYLGRTVEEGSTGEVLERPLHPYTRALLSAAPVAEYGRVKRRLRLTGETPSPLAVSPGCHLASRCPLAVETCSVSTPLLEAVAASHLVACPVAVSEPGRLEALVTTPASEEERKRNE